VAGLGRLAMGIPKKTKKRKKRKEGVVQSWQGDFLFLARSFSWMHHARAENHKGVEG
jgi:hypothetical protein